MCISIIWPPKFIKQPFNLTHPFGPNCKYLYLCERLSNSLLKQVKKSPYNLIKFTQLVLLMQVNNANILQPKGMLYKAVML